MIFLLLRFTTAVHDTLRFSFSARCYSNAYCGDPFQSAILVKAARLVDFIAVLDAVTCKMEYTGSSYEGDMKNGR